MSLRVRWEERRARARRVNDQLAAQDGRSRLDDLDRRGQQQGRRLSDAEMDRLGEQLGVPQTVLPCRSAGEIRARVVAMIHAAEVLLSTPEGGSFTRGGQRSLERLLAYIDGDDDEG